MSYISNEWIKIKNKKLFPLMCRVNADVLRFIPQNIKIVFFHFYFLNQDFFLTIISITLLFDDLVDHLEGTRNFDLSPSFHFMTKTGNFLLLFVTNLV